jgi:Spy/CpxP family protein refolding chaperone
MKPRLIAVPLILAAATALVQAQVPTSPATAAAAAHQQVRAKRLAAIRHRNAKALGLTPAQKAQAKTIRQQARLSAQPTLDKMKQNRQALSAAVKTGDTAQIQALSKTQGELRGQAMAIRSEARAQIYAGLTIDQRQKLDERQSRMQQRFANRQANRTSNN